MSAMKDKKKKKKQWKQTNNKNKPKEDGRDLVIKIHTRSWPGETKMLQKITGIVGKMGIWTAD